jgi:hypothetical protein
MLLVWVMPQPSSHRTISIQWFRQVPMTISHFWRLPGNKDFIKGFDRLPGRLKKIPL